MSRRHRKAVFIATGCVIAVVGLLSVISLVTSSLEENVSYGNIAVSLIGVGTTAASIITFALRRQPVPPGDQAADTIAARLLDQWTAEVRHRRQHFGNARTVPLTWRKSDPALAADPATVFGEDARFGKVELKLDGRTGTNPDQAALRLAEAFNSVPSRRLVVIGKPGSGKTFLGIILTIGLLRSRAPGSPVPMFLSLSSWDPVVDTLEDWLVETLASLHYGDDPATPRTLLSQQLVLPILDGLDELPEHFRRPAINKINEALQGDLPLVLTCRSNEYREEITGGAPVLLRTPVVELLPVKTVDVVRNLKDNSHWKAVVDHIEQHPQGPIGTALTTPLMLSLFTATFERRDPQALLDKQLKTGHAVENYLLDQLVDSAYPPADATAMRKEKKWLTRLAEYLHKNGKRDLNWWELADRATSTIGTMYLTLPTATLALAGVVSLAHLASGVQLLSPLELFVAAPVVDVFLLGLTVSAFRLHTGGPTRRRSFWSGAATGMLWVSLLGLGYLIVTTSAQTTIDATDVIRVSTQATALLALSIVAGLTVGAHQLAKHGSTGPKKGGPTRVLHQSRKTALTSSLSAGLVAGALAIPLATIAASIGGHFGERIAVAFSFPTVAEIHLPRIAYYGIWSEFAPTDLRLTLVGMFEVFVLCAAALLSSHTWTWFTATRFALFLGRRSPWRVMHHLNDAREHGILRVAGASYQFWHVTLQERLVSEAQKRPLVHPKVWRLAGASVTAILLITSISLIALNEPSTCATTGWQGADARMARTFGNHESACFAFLDDDDLRHLTRSGTDSDLLTKIESVHEPKDNSTYSIVAVAGKFTELPTTEMRAVLQGVAAAQSLAEDPLIVDFVYADGERSGDSSMNSLASTYVSSRGSYHPKHERAASAIVNIDASQSKVAPDSSVDSVVIGSRDLDLPSLAAQYSENLAKNRLTRYKEPGDLAPGELEDGVSDEECAQLKNRNDLSFDTYDLRRADLTDALLKRISACGSPRLLITYAQVTELRLRIERLPTLSFDYIHDTSAELATKCRDKLSSKAPQRATDTCTAALSGGSDFGVGFTTLLSGR
ncbi:NACHT domain-containing NTPase [Amycolatopsis sp. cg9]|uniref:NACHT domain-containing protein n=1 Tax=Amycolatopsis sp. cg9 TaxID=3238801 RepID=UPI0035232B6F